MKRKHSGVGALGLGGYASDEDEEGADGSSGSEAEDHGHQADKEQRQQDVVAGGGILLPMYRSRESIDFGEGEEEGQEPMELQRPQTGEGEAEGGDQQRRSPSATAATSGDTGAGQQPAGSAGQPPAPGAAASPLMRLPPELREPLPEPCPEALQRKFAQFHSALRSRGICLTDQICHRKAFRNPDFLQKLVEHFGVQQHGSAFPPHVFDPGALPAEDTAEGLLRALEREQERRAKLREQQQAAGAPPRIDFARGAGALGHLPASGSASNLMAQQQAAQAAAQATAQAVAARVLGARR